MSEPLLALCEPLSSLASNCDVVVVDEGRVAPLVPVPVPVPCLVDSCEQNKFYSSQHTTTTRKGKGRTHVRGVSREPSSPGSRLPRPAPPQALAPLRSTIPLFRRRPART